MNIIEAGHAVGLEMASTPWGKSLLGCHDAARRSVSSEAWRLFHRIRDVLGDYYSFPNAFNVVEKVPAEASPNAAILSSLRTSIQLRRFCSMCLDYGRSLDGLVITAMGTTLPSSFGDFPLGAPMRRAIEDLHITLHTSGLVHTAMMLADRKTNQLGSISREYETRIRLGRSLPFSRQHRRLIREMARNEDEVDSLYATESIISLLRLMREAITESHLGLGLYLASGNVISLRRWQRGSIEPFVIELSPLSSPVMGWNGCLAQVHHQGTRRWALVTGWRIKFRGSEGPETTLRGLLYPMGESEGRLAGARLGVKGKFVPGEPL